MTTSLSDSLKACGLPIQRLDRRTDVFQLAETLKRNRQKRSQCGCFVVEGVSSVNAALKNGWEFESIYFGGDRDLSDWAVQCLKSAHANNLYALSNELMQELSEKEETSELVAVLKIPADDLKRIPLNKDSVVLVFDRPISPGNLGSSIRSADAFNASGIVVVGHAADVYDPQTVRSSVGTLFSIPAVRIPAFEEVAHWLTSAGIRIPLVGTSAQGDRELKDAKLQLPIAIAFGNETSGLSVKFKQQCSQLLRIPINGTASSLNVSSAVSIVLYELRRG